MKIVLIIKNGNSIWFDLYDKDKITKSIPFGGNPSDLYKYLNLDGWDSCKKFVGDGVEISTEHFRLEYLCKDAEDGEDGCTIYLDKKCRNCRCKQTGFIKKHQIIKLF